MPWARASSLHRFLACPAASWLPRWDDGRNQLRPAYLGVAGRGKAPPLLPELLVPRSMAAAERGRRAHAAKERGELFPELWPTSGPGRGWHEVAVSYCCATGTVRWLADVNERTKNLWKALQCEHAIVGTADWFGVMRDGTLWVDDLKTGWSVPEVRTPQLLFYALCLHDMAHAGVSRWATGTPGAVQLSVTHWPSASPKKAPARYWHRVTALELEEFRFELIDAWRMTQIDARPRVGPHCSYCPSAAWCPAQAGLVSTKD